MSNIQAKYEMTKDELFELKISSYNQEEYEKSKRIWDNFAKPLDGFGDFEEVVSKINAIQGLDIEKRAAVIFCADNGVVEEGVTQCGCDVTRRVAESLGAGISTACVLGKSASVDIIPVDIGIRGTAKIEGVLDKKIAEGTRNFLKEPAMSEEQTIEAINVGIDMVRELKDKGYRIIAAGEMGIGNTTTSAAVLSALLHIEPERVAGRGAGLDDKGFEKKVEVINLGIQKYSDGFGKDDLYLNGVYRSNEFETFENNVSGIRRKESALHTLYSLGGLDIAGLVGLFIGGAIYHIPIVLDGVITGAAAVCAELLVPGVRDFIIPSHSGREAGNEVAISFLGLKSYINGNMALGEGTGAIMLFPLLDTIFAYYKNGADFSSYKMDAYKRF